MRQYNDRFSWRCCYFGFRHVTNFGFRHVTKRDNHFVCARRADCAELFKTALIAKIKHHLPHKYPTHISWASKKLRGEAVPDPQERFTGDPRFWNQVSLQII